MDDLWTDWTIENVEHPASQFSDNVAERGSCTLVWQSTRSSVSSSLTVSLPDDYVGGTYAVAVTASSGANTDTATAVIDVA